jgi:hypothetical protein
VGQIRVGANYLSALSAYAEAVNRAANDAMVAGAAALQESLREHAAASARWGDAAEHITVEARDGRFHVGVSHKDFISEAMSAEYGDEMHPPVPVIRTGMQHQEKVAQVTGDIMSRQLGWTSAV